MDIITAHELWESARQFVDKADELAVPVVAIEVMDRVGVRIQVARGIDDDVRDEVDRIGNRPARYFSTIYSRGCAYGNSGVTLPDGVRVTVDSSHTLGVETSGGSCAAGWVSWLARCHVTLNDLRILRESPTPVRGGVVFTRDLLAALDKIAARELTVVAVSA